MRFTFALFFFYLVPANAGSVVAKSSMNKIKAEITQNYKEAAARLKHDIDQIFLKRAIQVKSAVSSVEALRITNNTCVAAESEKFLSTFESFSRSMQDCRDVATKSSKKILSDIIVFVQQLETECKDLIRFYQDCQKYTGILSKLSCNRGWESIVTEYQESVRKSFKEIKHSTNERIYYAVIEADSCSKNPFEDCIYDLAFIYKTMNNCFARLT